MANSTTQFGGFLTNVGIAQQANTAALGLPWNITHMLIGDAGGERGLRAQRGLVEDHRHGLGTGEWFA